MAAIKVFFILAITMALSIAITMRSFNNVQEASELSKDMPSMQEDQVLEMPSKRVSRFLAAHERNPRAADHCHKDNEICSIVAGKNTTCCNNKCMDLQYDHKNCGACKRKCKFPETCCRGECVNVAYDKRHCGYCNHRCEYGQFCVYGLCGYA